jgi:hypothetical protein
MSKASVITLVMIVLFAAGALLVNREFTQAQERPSVQRLESRRRLVQFATAIEHYRASHQAWPDTLFQLMKDQHLGFGANLVRGAGTYRYRRPEADDAPDRPVMWSDQPHRAVLAGEPWGGEGDIATRDHPAVAFVLTRDLRVEERIFVSGASPPVPHDLGRP